MAGKYARIPGMKLLRSVLDSIPVLFMKRKPLKALTVPIQKISPVLNKISAQQLRLSQKLDKSMVYVLQLTGGLIYVGQSNNVERRIQQHMRGQGAVFTKRHKPTGVRLTRLGNVNGAGDSGERQEVLLQMRTHGMHNVRGWKYCNNTLSSADVLDIKSNWVEMFNLCRKCMKPGHMASFCKQRK
jgi:hypothetical protein